MAFVNPYHFIPGLRSLKVDQITCWIEGHHGPKYVGSPRCSGNALSGWIESVAGQTFTVNWHNNQRDYNIEGALYIDGVLCDTHIVPEASSFPEDRWSIANIGFIQVSPTSRRNFVFTDTNTLLNDDIPEAPSAANNLGTIRLEIRRVKVDKVETMKSDYVYQGEALTNRFGQEYPQPFVRPIKVVTHGRRIDQEPMYTFTFMYRPLGTSQMCSYKSFDDMVLECTEYLLERNLFPSQFKVPPPVIRVLTDAGADSYLAL
ncbi:hypothetical protein CVT26_009223 [Gymnopilus dilepis]|uniref:DUF7918 domain-containing protein n=1 Tax=Gymnopilus dilepis TaxID=231916 RepID=A0A409WCA4_9AGAR|nr:hypothetical protein CVT26_009223 [Gymnopilus dilepis]